jgi:hypothetical protein
MPSNVLHQTLEDAAGGAPGRLAVEEGEDPASHNKRTGSLDALQSPVESDGLIGTGLGKLISLSDPLFGFPVTLVARR